MAKKEVLINREISWLHFNERVLQEAMDKRNPLIERLKFLGIFSNNRDEFFRVRVATVRRLMMVERSKGDKMKFNPQKLLNQILDIVEEQEKKFTNTYHNLKEELSAENIVFLDENDLNENQGMFVVDYFNTEVRPFLFPIMLKNFESPSTLRDNAIYLVVTMIDSSGQHEEDYCIIKIPTDRLGRFIQLPSEDKKHYIIMLDDVIRHSIGEIFRTFGYDSFNAYTIKFTRDAELDIDEDISKSFVELMTESVKKRKKGVPVRFVYDREMPEMLLQELIRKLDIRSTDTLRGGSKYHNFRDFMSFPKLGSKKLVNPVLPPVKHKMLPHYKSILEIIRKRDIMLHYPYQSFQYIVDLLREAAIDPKVRAIKMTFYRAARYSNVINSLINAARNGKSVTVFLEIQARFDEEANIFWAERLSEEGVKIIKTLPGFKVHAKLMLIRRKEEGENIYYTNISTGNFNESTARIYADDSLLTANQDIAREVNTLFHLFEQPYNPPRFKHLLIAPYHLRDTFTRLINTEIRNQKAGKEAWIRLKLNSLVDEKIIRKLYQASKAGVKIDIICRGICRLIPQVKGMSEHITVISIVDKYLEHSRCFIFANKGEPKFYSGSSDWMVRNFDHRFEVVVPIYDPEIQRDMMDIFEIQWADNIKARLVNVEPINQYKEREEGEKEVRAQLDIYNYLKAKHENGS
ncbi:MAG: polyphosphate kinase 1 [bacterium]|jgi:polyphosphate kinase